MLQHDWNQFMNPCGDILFLEIKWTFLCKWFSYLRKLVLLQIRKLSIRGGYVVPIIITAEACASFISGLSSPVKNLSFREAKITPSLSFLAAASTTFRYQSVNSLSKSRQAPKSNNAIY